MKEMILLVDSHHGVYSAQILAEQYGHRLSGVTAEELDILKSGPETEWYWDTWNDVEGAAILTDDDDNRYILWQNEDIWAIPEEWEWSEDEQTYKASEGEVYLPEDFL